MLYQRTLNHWLSSLPRCRNSPPFVAVLVQSVSRVFDVISGQQRVWLGCVSGGIQGGTSLATPATLATQRTSVLTGLLMLTVKKTYRKKRWNRVTTVALAGRVTVALAGREAVAAQRTTERRFAPARCGCRGRRLTILISCTRKYLVVAGYLGTL